MPHKTFARAGCGKENCCRTQGQGAGGSEAIEAGKAASAQTEQAASTEDEDVKVGATACDYAI
jgi:hypothetical protein